MGSQLTPCKQLTYGHPVISEKIWSSKGVHYSTSWLYNCTSRFFYNKSYSIILHVQYRPEGLQHLHARKIRVMWLFYTCVMRFTCKLRARKKLHELLHTLQLHANCVDFDGSRNLFLFIHAQCVPCLWRNKKRPETFWIKTAFRSF